MPLKITRTRVKNVLTRTSGFLSTVTSHSLQPYRGCTFGNSLCGAGCYVQHNPYVMQGRTWGGFLEVRENAAESYREHFEKERAWARRTRGEFSIFCSSSTEPFLPQEKKFGITSSLLEAMLEAPPDLLILQTHSHTVADRLGLIEELAVLTHVRVHVSIETDRERIPGLPPPGSSVEQRFQACAALRGAGIETVVTVAPLLPIDRPETFFERIARVADGVVIDHFIGGDGSRNGSRTLKTSLPAMMKQLDPDSVSLTYRDRMAEIAQRFLPGRVGMNTEGFAARYLPDPRCSSPGPAPGPSPPSPPSGA